MANIKNVQLPEEVLKIINDIHEKEEQEVKDIIQEVKDEHKTEWDVKKDEPIYFFDPELSYELTGYKPLTNTKGLDFDPSWFTEARERYKQTGQYTQYRKGTKAYNEFWTEEYNKCRDGMTSHGYTITGDHYFFLNYYQLMITTRTTKAMEGRIYDFPDFLAIQYEYLHYVEMCKRLRKNVAMMKSRGVE